MPRWLPVLLLPLCFSCSHSDKNKSDTSAPDQPLAEGTFSEAFQASLDTTLSAYHDMVRRFAAGDSDEVNKFAGAFGQRLRALSFDDVKRDTPVFKTATQQQAGTVTEMQGLLGEMTFSGKLQELNMVSQDLYDLLRTVRYGHRELYFMECPSAFGDSMPGDWIAPTADSAKVLNPYTAGKNGAGACAQVRDSVGKP